MILPLTIDKTPKGKLVVKADFGEVGYIENIQYWLKLSFEGNNVFISYYGEDDTELTDKEIKKLIQESF